MVRWTFHSLALTPVNVRLDTLLSIPAGGICLLTEEAMDRIVG